jgi:uncharacterized membrane protein/nitrite reductase/ring-hydroxylating ferredoxin subunit
MNMQAQGSGTCFSVKFIFMKSKASIKGHPLHPILVGFPIAFFTGTLVFDFIGCFTDNDELLKVGYYLELCGIITAVAAAIPGLIDYTFTVPPASSGKKRAAKHGITNTSMLILFSIAFYYRQQETNLPVVLVLQGIGFILMMFAGWMGGTLVYKNQIAVVNRYAHAGKWNEQYITGDAKEVEVGTADELKLNQMKLVHYKNKRIVIAKADQGYVAFDDHCTHKGGSLAGGMMICGTVQCPWHGTQFDVHTGQVKAGPGSEKIDTYSLQERNGKLILILNS